ncbi:uncharacterized protein RJT21DRAFT_118977 [Scheffersomyces amazonensis]|uniref:uncharacterized protein n=1 Tax=Scheffersomyces amazonensis TaxID=1078765 RepID=UPI00315D7697
MSTSTDLTVDKESTGDEFQEEKHTNRIESNGEPSLTGNSISEEDDEDDHHVQQFAGEEEIHDNELNHPLSRTASVIHKVQTGVSFFNDKIKSHRKSLALRFGVIYLVMSVLILGIFSIYWGSMIGRFDRIRNLRMLVVIDEEEMNGVPPIFGDQLRTILATGEAQYYGDWHIYNHTEFINEFGTERSVENEISRQIHHQNYWSSLYVKPQATYNFYQALINGDTTYNATNNSIISIYETGRDFLNMNSYVLPSIEGIEFAWLDLQSNVTLPLIQIIQSGSHANVFNNPSTLAVLGSSIGFGYFDQRVWTDPVIVAPSQVGLIYMIIMTFFQFNFFVDVHKDVLKIGIKRVHFMIYRIISSIVSFLIISLVYSLVSLAAQVDFTKSYGRGGFVVYWMISFLCMWAVGLANEIAGMLLIIYYPPVVGFWMLFWVIINISPTFTPLALSPKFYRYGYGLPIHNAYEATKVILFNTWRGQMGRNVGILIAWCAILTIAMPFVVKFFGKKMGEKAREAMQAQMKEMAAKQQQQEEIQFEKEKSEP